MLRGRIVPAAVVFVSLAVFAGAMGCKSENRRVAEDLREQVLEPLRAAKAGADSEEQANFCLAATMVVEAPRVAAQVNEPGSEAAGVLAEIREECHNIASAQDFVSEEIIREEHARDEAAIAAAEAAAARAEAAAAAAAAEAEAAEAAAAAEAEAQADDNEDDDSDDSDDDD